MPTVFRMCMKQIKIARGIPFSTRLPENVVTRAEALEAFEETRRQAADVPEMSLDEINEEVLHRPKFHLSEDVIQTVISAVKRYGIEVFPQPTGEILIDMDDLVFYEVALDILLVYLTGG